MANIIEIGKKIKDRRMELNLTLDEIAVAIGVTKSTIQRYENAKIKNVKLPVLDSIAQKLEVNPNWLLGKTENKFITTSDELNEYLEELRTRPELRMLFSISSKATKEDVEQAVKIIEALKKTNE